MNPHDEMRALTCHCGRISCRHHEETRAGCDCTTTRRFSELAQSVKRTWSDGAHTVYDAASASFAADVPDETPASRHVSDHYFTD